MKIKVNERKIKFSIVNTKKEPLRKSMCDFPKVCAYNCVGFCGLNENQKEE